MQDTKSQFLARQNAMQMERPFQVTGILEMGICFRVKTTSRLPDLWQAVGRSHTQSKGLGAFKFSFLR